MKQKNFTTVLTCLVLMLSTGFVIAKPPRQHKEPPPEAYELCENKTLDEAVTITTREGEEVPASCQYLPDDDSVLVAMPDDKKRHKGHSQ